MRFQILTLLVLLLQSLGLTKTQNIRRQISSVVADKDPSENKVQEGSSCLDVFGDGSTTWTMATHYDPLGRESCYIDESKSSLRQQIHYQVVYCVNALFGAPFANEIIVACPTVSI